MARRIGDINEFKFKHTGENHNQSATLIILSSLVAALARPSTLLAATNFIDGKWSMAVDRSDKAGKLLAEMLLKGLHGYRPVTLIAYPLGARVTFKCLEHLAISANSAGIVKRVVLPETSILLRDEN
jgi:hypothetical protein